MGQIIIRGTGPTRISNIQIVIEPNHYAMQLPMRLKSEIFAKVISTAEVCFDANETTQGEMQFKFPKRRLPKRCHSAIEVFARWTIA